MYLLRFQILGTTFFVPFAQKTCEIMLASLYSPFITKTNTANSNTAPLTICIRNGYAGKHLQAKQGMKWTSLS